MKSLFVAWRPSTPELGWRPVGRLTHDGDLFRFWYTRGARKHPFRPFAQMEKLDEVYESDELFPLFANRLLSDKRPEYEAYLRWGGFDVGNQPDPIVVLGVTDGIRWMHPAAIARINELASGEELKLMLDFQNEYDPQAVAVRSESARLQIGYVPRYLANDVGHLVGRCDPSFIKLCVERVNPDAPFQNRVLCKMHACWPDTFQPCRGEDFDPIRNDVPVRCGS